MTSRNRSTKKNHIPSRNPGQREFVNMLPLVCNDAVAILFMFDLSRKSTLNSIKEWYRQARGFNKVRTKGIIFSAVCLMGQLCLSYHAWLCLAEFPFFSFLHMTSCMHAHAPIFVSTLPLSNCPMSVLCYPMPRYIKLNQQHNNYFAIDCHPLPCGYQVRLLFHVLQGGARRGYQAGESQILPFLLTTVRLFNCYGHYPVQPNPNQHPQSNNNKINKKKRVAAALNNTHTHTQTDKR